jgi:chitodextrinase
MLKRCIISSIAGISFLALSALSVLGSNVLLQWNASSDNVAVTGYNIYRNGVKIGTSPTTNYTDTTAQPGMSYNYAITAFNAAGNESGPSTVANLMTAGGGTSVAFTPLHIYFISPTGRDSNNGLTPAAAWRTPNHAVVCGDVILAQAGSYTSSQFSDGNFGAVSGCPSGSAGVDGNGAIYAAVLLCAGTDLEACQVTGEVAPKSNWSVQGFKSNGNNGATRSFMVYSATQTDIRHHIAFINNVAYNSSQGFGMSDCPGGTCNHNVPGNGVDYWAVVGNIAHNANLDGICLAAIDYVGAANWDSGPGTHSYIAGNFAWKNQVACYIDGEAYMLDTLDAHGYSGKIVVKDNIGYRSTRYGLNLFTQHYNVSSPLINIYQNTLYGNLAGPVHDNDQHGSNPAEINTNFGASLPWIVNIYNNIAQSTYTSIGGNSINNWVWAFIASGNYPSNMFVGAQVGAGKENIFKGLQSSCVGGGTCNASFDVTAFNGGSFGTNVYVDPAFKNTADLLANHMAAPNCSGFLNVAACMGWNGTSVVANSVIDDLTPTAAQAAGKGYQTPKACAADSDYPAWLKGLVYLRASGWVNGATITQNSGLISRPCNM